MYQLSSEAKEYERMICGMSEEKFQSFLEELPEDMKTTMILLRATHKLFTDVAYHKYMKQSIVEIVAHQMYKETHTAR